MAKYEITAPDGGRYEIEAPDNMPDSQVADMVRQRFTPSEKPLNWSDVPGQALKNAPESAGRFVSGIAHSLAHPIQTVTDLADVAAGGLRAGAKKVLPEAVFNAIDRVDNPETTKRIEEKSGAVGSMLADRYGSMEGLKNTLATDPVGALADASTALTGGGAIASRAPGIVGRVGEAASRAGSAIDPISAVGRTVAAGGRAGAEALGVATGVGARPFQEAFRAGDHGNPAFTEHMRGQRPLADVVDMAEAGVAQMGRERGAAYTAGMAGVRGSPETVHFTPVFQAIQNARNETHFSGVPIDAAAADVVQRINDITHQFARIPGPANPARFDALKRAVGEIRQRTQQGTLEHRVAGNIYNTIRDEVSRQVPQYAATMRDYANASDNIGEMRRTMSINDRASTDTTLRKLQSTMRNNVQASYGHRETMLNELAHSQPNLPAALAGQTLNSMAPRGLARISPMSIVASGGATMNPAVLAALPFTSPRLMGEVAHAAGQGAGAVRRVLERAGVPPRTIAAILRSAYVGNIPERAKENKRAKSGAKRENAGRGLIGLGNATR